MDVTPRLYCPFSNSAPYKVRTWADHRVAPTHYIDAFAEIVDVRMRSRNIGQANIRELTPTVIEKLRSAVGLVAHRIVVRQNSRTVIDPLLMRRVHVTERWAFVKHIVPRERKVACEPRLWSIFQKHVRDEPCVVMKLRRGERCIVCEALN